MVTGASVEDSTKEQMTQGFVTRSLPCGGRGKGHRVASEPVRSDRGHDVAPFRDQQPRTPATELDPGCRPRDLDSDRVGRADEIDQKTLRLGGEARGTDRRP